jgi:HPt (histidine-containing phosphotransfer) domain-containing protein
MDDILSKPYTLEDCARLLQRWVARSTAPARAAEPPVAAVATIAVAPRPSEELATVDASTVSALRNLDTGKHDDLYAELVELFQGSLAQSLGDLEAALARDDLKAAAAVCHKLASAAANVGALAYSKRVRELERHAIAAEREAARTACEALLAAHAPLRKSLQSHCLRATA